ncbi:MAG: hypothetical protein NT133_00465 [Alphaproteobacteria bacterium]|nr:hypothetical protein [Alphaproteobacteria bacterium]
MADDARGSIQRVLVHDTMPQLLDFLPLVRICVGSDFDVIKEGVLGKPLDNEALKPRLLGSVHAGSPRRVFLAVGVRPFSRTMREMNGREQLFVRSLLPVGHPLGRIVTLFDNRVGFASLPPPEGEPTLEWFVRASLATALNNIPAANFQNAYLLGGAWGLPIDEELAADAASFVDECTTPLLVDFPNVARATLVAALLEAGQPVAQDAYRPADAQSTLVARLKRLKRALPERLFDDLCWRNAADLLLFERVILRGVERAAVSTEDRALMTAEATAAVEMCPYRAHERGFVARDPKKSFFDADPLLGWWPRPEARFPMTVLGRKVVMETDRDGLRPVIGQPTVGDRTVTLYGCSFTYGWSVTAEETFASVLQAMRPTWRVENRGVGGFGTGHNLLQLQRDTRFEMPDFVTFCHIPALVRRAVADWEYIAAFQSHHLIIPVVRVFPKAYLDAEGELAFRTIPFWRPEIVGINHRDFAPDLHYLDLVALKIYERADRIVRDGGGRFFVTLLFDHITPFLRGALARAGIEVVDAELHGSEWTNLPDDNHPNVAAHRHYAERIDTYLTEVSGSGAHASAALEMGRA